MKKKAIAAAMGVLAAGFTGFSMAGPEKIKYPADYLRGDLYATIDRADIKQYRELYASPGVVASVRAGKGIPRGAVLTLVQWSVHQDANGNPLKDSSGRFIKNAITGHTVMEKREGWGAEYPADLRNGEWEYSVFTPDGTFNPKPNFKSCFECHKPHEKMDFVISLAKLEGKFPEVAALKKAAKSDVNIVSFAFAPAKYTATAGKAMTFLNSDDSPHQITVQGPGGQKSAVILRGQTASMTFDKAGGYNYICGLHPTMKGTIDVK